MNRSSMEFICQAMDAITGGKHDPETEQCLTDAIEEELLAMNARLVLASWHANMVCTLEVDGHIA